MVEPKSSDLIDFVEYTLTIDSVTTPFAATVDLAKAAKSNLETFKVIVCWSYSTYNNLTDLCNESTQHSVVNALGFCLTEF